MSDDYKRRRTSMLAPFGIGALTIFPNDEAFMIAGIKDWFKQQTKYNNGDWVLSANRTNWRDVFERFEISDPRLVSRLTEPSNASPIKLMSPPTEDDEWYERGCSIRYSIGIYRFPLWYFCPECHRMKKLEPDTLDPNQGFPHKTNNCRGIPVPERFVAVCENGHIEDFPIGEWVHQKSGKEYHNESCVITRHVGASAGLSGITYSCETCKISQNMQGAFSRGALDTVKMCSGNMPWLNSRCACGNRLQTIQRGASNIWFGHNLSSLKIPVDLENDQQNQNSETYCEFSEDLIKNLLSIADALSQIPSDQRNELLSYINPLSEAYPELQGRLDEAISLIQAQLHDPANPSRLEEESYRAFEYEVLKENRSDDDDDDLTIKAVDPALSGIPFLSKLSLVTKLKETRVFTGFSRLSDSNPPPPLSEGNNPNVNWLPAVQETGEGIFIEFDMAYLDEWANKPDVVERMNQIKSNIKNIQGFRTVQDDQIPTNPIFVLLHTFAHCLINTLAIEGGYPNTSIKERVYCSKFAFQRKRMAGILIYTASGDSMGSMGGLVRQGKPERFAKVVKRAIEDTRWCAADPVCIDSRGQGLFGSNLAACHNCVLLPETSCEERNMFLDRGLMIGTIKDKELGFFNSFYSDN